MIFEDLNLVGPEMQDYIKRAVRYGIIKGYSDGTFRPNEPVTRAQMCAFAVRLYEMTNEDFVEVMDQVVPAVAMINNIAKGSLGSGSVIHPGGYMLTNEHVINGATSVNVDFPDRIPLAGAVLFADPAVDLALVKLPDSAVPWPHLPMPQKAYQGLKQGAQVLAIGSPLGLFNSVSQGVVAAFRDTLFSQSAGTFIQTTAQINPGNSGGALVDLFGRLVGVPTRKVSMAGIEGLNFAIAQSTVRLFLAKCKDARVLPAEVYAEITSA